MRTIEIFQGKNGQWYWRIRHRNGQVVATGGEGYLRRGYAVRALRRLLEDAALLEQAR